MKVDLTITERKLVCEAIDELLLTVNNHCNPEYAKYDISGYEEELRRRTSLQELRKKFCQK